MADRSEAPPALPGDAPAVELRSRTLMCSNTKFDVFFDHVRGASGGEIEQYLSVVPRSCPDDLVSGIGVLPELGGRLGLIRVHRHPQGRSSWEIVRGFIDEGETHEQAALRELTEETGLDGAGVALADLGIVAPDAGVIRARIHLYAARAAQLPARPRCCELGHGDVLFLPPDQVLKLVLRGEVEDACSVVAILRYACCGGARAADL